MSGRRSEVPDTGAYLSQALADQPPGPIYQRIVEFIGHGIRGGQLHPGDRLPTHRALATDLGVAVPTVTRAYREAERQGLITSGIGRGTFVAGIPDLRAADDTRWDEHTVIDLSVNGPARGEHEQLLRRTLQQIADDADLSILLGYSPDIGRAGDRAAAASWLTRKTAAPGDGRDGFTVDPEHVVLCHGGQHALLIALAAATNPSDVIFTEELTYPGLKTAANMLNVRVVGAAMDEFGLRPDALADACRTPIDGRRPAALYITPTAHNPTAVTMSPQRRDQIVAVARANDMLIVEDDVFGFLTPQPGPAPIAALAPERTLLISSLSKTVTPGLRWGAVVAPRHLIDRLGTLVRASIFNPAPTTIAVARRWFDDGIAARLAAWQRTEMADRFAAAHDILHTCPAVETIRTAGLHAWVQLRAPWTPEEAIAAAHAVNVAVSPTAYFRVQQHPHPDTDSEVDLTVGVRLCLGNAANRDLLTEALTRLRRAWDPGPSYSTGTRI